jgi:CheY-like chemotaxis protein
MPRVMLVDGYDSVRRLYALHLHAYGLEVENIATFAEGLERLKTDPQFDAIFANVNYYQQVGFRFIETVAHAYPEVPVVVILQIKAWGDTERRLYRLGVRDYLVAPTLRKDFREILETLNLYRAPNF